MNRILTGNDRARELGFKSYREWILALADKTGYPWTGEMCESLVYARVDFGRWICDCEQGHASYVEPSDKFFYCYMCGNAVHDGKGRRVIFPENCEEIEKELLRRSVKLTIGLPQKLMEQPTQVAMNSRGVDSPLLNRCWNPGETVEMLRAQRMQFMAPPPI